MSASTDIVEIVDEFRRSFMRIGLRPPAAIILASREEGMRLLGQVQKLEPFVRPALGPNDEPLMEIEVMGMKVQWPEGSWT